MLFGFPPFYHKVQSVMLKLILEADLKFPELAKVTQ